MKTGNKEQEVCEVQEDPGVSMTHRQQQRREGNTLGNTVIHKWATTARITHFVRPCANSDEPHLLTLTGIAHVRLTEPPQVVNDLLPLPRLDISYPPQDADSPPAADVVQDFKAATIHLLERFSQDTSQSARKRESWTRVAHLVEETTTTATTTATGPRRPMTRELDTVVTV